MLQGPIQKKLTKFLQREVQETENGPKERETKRIRSKVGGKNNRKEEKVYPLVRTF